MNTGHFWWGFFWHNANDRIHFNAKHTLLLCDNEWKGHLLQMWMIGHPSLGLHPYMSKRRGADSHGRNDRWLKALSLCLAFHPLIFPPLCLSLYLLWLPCLSLTFSLPVCTFCTLPHSPFLLFSTCMRVWRLVTWQWTSPSYGTAISSLTIQRRLKVPLPSITTMSEKCYALNPQRKYGS